MIVVAKQLVPRLLVAPEGGLKQLRPEDASSRTLKSDSAAVGGSSRRATVLSLQIYGLAHLLELFAHVDGIPFVRRATEKYQEMFRCCGKSRLIEDEYN